MEKHKAVWVKLDELLLCLCQIVEKHKAVWAKFDELLFVFQSDCEETQSHPCEA